MKGFLSEISPEAEIKFSKASVGSMGPRLVISWPYGDHTRECVLIKAMLIKILNANKHKIPDWGTTFNTRKAA